MRKIAFIHPGSAYAPELWAYRQFLEKNGFFVQVFKSANENELSGFDVEWHIMGTDRTPRKKDRIKIHEYVSLSIPPYAKLKDRLKKQINTLPDIRVFGSQFIQKRFWFKDNLPSFYRDAAVAEFFFGNKSIARNQYDFVYSGSTHKSRKIVQFLDAFIKYLPGRNLLIIGTVPPNLPKRILHTPSIVFSGPLPYQQVPAYLLKARYAINFIPDVYPFNQQRPLKMLEYCAVGLPVITTSYNWVNQFEQDRNARFFKLKPDLRNLDMRQIESFDYHTPDVADLVWENILQKSGIVNWLEGELHK